ncbi:MAG: efflux RND transporter periplasmic adaptor subunit [Nannocystaceae bacterium]
MASEPQSPAAARPGGAQDLHSLIARESSRHRRRRLVLALVALTAVGGAAAAFVALRPRPTPPAERFREAPLSRGEVIRQVSPTGRLEARVTVEVGAQVTGRIAEILVDYNAPVKKGQVLARLDPAALSAQVDQSEASRRAARAAVHQAKVQLEDAERRLARVEPLAAQGIESQESLDNARSAVALAKVAVESSSAQLALQSAGERLAKTNLDYTTIRSPIDGTVISRSVDVGQTVSAMLQAPVLFTLAQDLTKMRLLAAIDEAEIGQVDAGQHATFTVDAWPGEAFHAHITEVRRAPVLTQNVVTYEAVLEVDNPELKLRPGMTASVKIDTAEVADALRAPNAALRFTPPQEAGGEASSTPASAGPAVWTLGGDAPVRHPVKVGISDGRLTAIEAPDLAPGASVLIGLTPAGREHYGVGREE